MSKSISMRLALCAMFTALAVVANVFVVNVSRAFAISFVSVPCFFAGVLLGPIAGLAVGVVSDLLGFLIHPTGAFNALITLSTGLFGLIPGLLFRYVKGNVYVKAVFSFLLCLFVCTAVLNTLGLWLMYARGKKSFFVYLGVRFPFQALVSAINAFLAISLLVCLRRIPSLGKYFKVLSPREKHQNKECERSQSGDV